MASTSTSARTAQGKSISSQNARTHGLTAKHLKLAAEDQPDFDAMRDALNAALGPKGELEQALFDRIVHSSWNLRSLAAHEAALLNGFDPFNGDHSIVLSRLSLYRSRTESSLYKAQAELRKLQEERHLRDVALDDPQAYSPIVSIAKVQRHWNTLNQRQKKRTQPPPPPLMSPDCKGGVAAALQS